MIDKFVTLGIETSCDDTGIAILNGQYDILSSKLSSQISSHSQYGGVVPELASRMHQEAILPLLKDVFTEASITKPSKDINLIAVTAGPGLMGSLLVGVMTAKALSQGWGIPLIGVNHLEGHLFANIVANRDLVTPFISVIVSGGHTEIVLVKNFGNYELLGSTRDDAAGEAYDKVSKFLQLGYPGGPIIDKLAQAGNPDLFDLPMPLSKTPDIEFSFSGLKTATITLIQKAEKVGDKININDLCASFQKAVTGSLICKISLAVKKTGVKKVALSGGVAANSGLRIELSKLAEANNWQVYLPPKGMCTDNAEMIAAAGYNAHKRGISSDLSLSPSPSWPIW
ncbi:MAG: tRNA (adenosine(37)-N6)-threonylcarbamoyltransferase complex transferase subunit TsaD [Synergistaceae bacterium]|nr:tRNA (adenosine(37)-N6)-threonylcarbamoyltransferase complex transferase subunit TsaD [Synergistaceae bacterium]